MKSFEFTGKTVQKAIENGLEELGKKQEDVDIQILSDGGLFKKARVVISFEDEVLKTNFAPIAEEKVEQKEEPKEQKEEVKTEEPKVEEKTEEPKEEIVNNKVEETVVVEEPKEEEQHTDEKPEDLKETYHNEIEEKEKRFAERHYENNSTSLEFVEGLMKVMNIPATVTLEEKRDASEVNIQTENPGKVIGHRGEALSGIQYIANTIENAHNPKAKRVVVDAGDYKQKREESLRSLAIRVAGKVESTGKPYKLEPMNAFERRIVHTELFNYSSVETHSEGVEPYRHIVVTKRKK